MHQDRPRETDMGQPEGTGESAGESIVIKGRSAVVSAGRPSARLKVRRIGVKLRGDPTRVITRLFVPGYEDAPDQVFCRVADLPDEDVARLLAQTLDRYAPRHKDIPGVFDLNFERAAARTGCAIPDSPERRRLLGAYFTMEYALESVALFNPSIVPHPDQRDVPEGSCRFIMSLRACGEGHIASIEFRSGSVDLDGHICIDPVTPFTFSELRMPETQYEKHPFRMKLGEMGAYNHISERVLEDLGDFFQLDELERVVSRHRYGNNDREYTRQTLDSVVWLARSNYQLAFPEDSDISERVIFPVSENESRGIEDARFVRFVEDDGQVEYFATYSAYDGIRILPQFIETTDFRRFKIITLNGRYAQHKGMAMFPRRIDGLYMMVARVDGESLHLLPSDNRHFWNDAKPLQRPRYPWEFVQIGNCGSPMETSEGWLMLTHGVGPMRQYCIGAVLLDLHDPSRVLGQLREPLIAPTNAEAEGNVPSVVYSCGAMIHGGLLIIPYGAADTMTRIATVPVRDLLDQLLN